ncbi:hypothetical protein CHARACLAT_003888 [Characodon lateralis]|uniref:Uncharacterized protein n=1 Tax=Characodon lateralis TaxID=208331 RepID=A0ABU7DXH6_9TELE|nr:hypothetical protein [Characodon lateralis]
MLHITVSDLISPGNATRLPMKGAATGSIIGGIIGVILLMALIGTGIALYRKQKTKKLAEGPPRYKPPPPKKNNSSANRPMMSSNVPVTKDRRLQSQYSTTQSQEPVTDLDGYQEEDVDDCLEDHDGEHYFEVPPAYMETNVEPQDNNGGLHISRGESFVSSAMIV